MSLALHPGTISLQLHSVREEMERDPDSTLSAIAEIGYGAVEWFGELGDRSASEWRRILDRAGLRVSGAHLSLTELEQDPGTRLEPWQTIGCHLLACSAPEPLRPLSGDEWDDLGRRLDLLAYPLHAAGFALAYHHHVVELMGQGRPGLERIRGQWSFASISIEPDVFWLAWAGLDPVDELHRLADSPGRIRALHLKDGELPPERARDAIPYAEVPFRPLGEGDLDAEAILDAAADIGVETLVIEQDLPHHSPLEDAARSFAWLTDRLEP